MFPDLVGQLPMSTLILLLLDLSLELIRKLWHVSPVLFFLTHELERTSVFQIFSLLSFVLT